MSSFNYLGCKITDTLKDDTKLNNKINGKSKTSARR
jgi:hypothetical protein